MAAAKRYSPEQIVAKLREYEKLQGQGLMIPQACKRIGVSDQTFCRWRIKYGALKEDEAHRLKALEQVSTGTEKCTTFRKRIVLHWVFGRRLGFRGRAGGPMPEPQPPVRRWCLSL